MPEIRYADYERLIQWHARREAYKFASLRSNVMSFEDLVSEFQIVWCEASQSFDPERGVPFSAYLSRGIRIRVLELLRKEARHVTDVSMDESLGDEDHGGLHNVLPSTTAPSADDILAESQVVERFVQKLSPLTRQFLELLRFPPLELQQAVSDLQARAKYARGRGLVVTAPTHVTKTMIMDLMGLTMPERRQILGEIGTLSQKVNQK